MRAVWIVLVVWSQIGTSVMSLDLPPLAAPRLKVGAFNIQVFGKTKYEKAEVRSYLIKILARYDLLLVQEIRDSTETYMKKLLNDVNAVAPATMYMDISARLGNSTSKEQYAYIYRSDRLKVIEAAQYPLSIGYQQFERPPYMIHFRSETTVIHDFVIIGIHTKPSEAQKEIDNLDLAYKLALEVFNVKNILIAGDLNADCSYLHKEDKSNLILKKCETFNWLIGEDIDTTVGNSDCAYDRFITAGSDWKNGIVPGSVKTFDFEKEYHLSSTFAEDISDHFPIEFDMEGIRDSSVQNGISSKMSFTIDNSILEADLTNLRSIYRYPDQNPRWEIQVYKIETKMNYLAATQRDLSAASVIDELVNFSEGNVLSRESISFVQTYLNDSSFIEKSFVYGVDVKVITTYDVTVKCMLVSPYVCSITVSKSER